MTRQDALDAKQDRDDGMDDAERRLLEILADLQREYMERARPFQEMLARIHAGRPPRPIVIDVASLDQLSVRIPPP